MDKYQMLAELLSDEDKAKEILSESVEETSANLKKYDLDFSVEELIEISQAVAVPAQDGELNAEELDAVSGGVVPLLIAPIAAILIGTAAGAAIKKWRKK